MGKKSEADFKGEAKVVPRADRALIALQGPAAMGALQQLVDVDLAKLPFMNALQEVSIKGCNTVAPLITRCGYTGEDGFEISLPNNDTACVWKQLLKDPQV